MPLKPSNLSKSRKVRIKNLSYARSIIKLGKILYKMLRASSNADEIKEEINNLVDEIIHTEITANSELPVEDYLQNLRITAQVIANNTRIFSRERQSMKDELNTAYTNIQADESLSDDEKQSFIKTIIEIQNIVQPPSPPRNPPNR